MKMTRCKNETPKKFSKRTRKGFTLLELLAVLVIMTALAVIAVPIFMNKSDEAKQIAQKATVTTLEKQADMQKYAYKIFIKYSIKQQVLASSIMRM